MKKSILYMTTMLILIGFSFIHVSAQEAFTIDKLNVVMNVQENGEVEIEETYDLNFTDSRHGIYRNIANLYSMTWVNDNNKEIKKEYYFPISDVKCSTNSCDIEKNSRGIVVKMGDEDNYYIGESKMKISYKVHTRDLELDDAQMFYWNLTGGFDTEITKLNFSVKMPKKVNLDNISTYSGDINSTESDLEFKLVGNTITGHNTVALNNNDYATLLVDLPNDYFVFPEGTDYTIPSLVYFAIISAVIFGLFYAFGRDDKIIKTVQFGPPEGLTSADIGAIIDGTADKKDVLSLLIEWANKGYLKIHDREKGFALEKIKDMQESSSKNYEQILFNAIFKDKELVEEEDLKNSEVSTAFTTTRSMINERFQMNPDSKLYTTSSQGILALSFLLIPLIQGVVTFLYAFDKYQIVSLAFKECILSIVTIFILAIGLFLFKNKYTMSKVKLVLCGCTYVFLLLIIQFFQITLTADSVNMPLHVSLTGAVLTLAFAVLMLFMLKRSKNANIWLGQILGLKDFIVRCEKSKLEMFVHENPTIYYDILPYAYVLGVSDEWSKQFETIKIVEPSWYYSNQSGTFSTIIWWGYFHNSFAYMNRSGGFVPPATGGTGGGGFGGLGGGGFSGGGFGGGGGGSW